MIRMWSQRGSWPRQPVFAAILLVTLRVVSIQRHRSPIEIDTDVVWNLLFLVRTLFYSLVRALLCTLLALLALLDALLSSI
jgi:hypothetical protein